MGSLGEASQKQPTALPYWPPHALLLNPNHTGVLTSLITFTAEIRPGQVGTSQQVTWSPSRMWNKRLSRSFIYLSKASRPEARQCPQPLRQVSGVQTSTNLHSAKQKISRPGRCCPTVAATFCKAWLPSQRKASPPETIYPWVIVPWTWMWFSPKEMLLSICLRSQISGCEWGILIRIGPLPPCKWGGGGGS